MITNTVSLELAKELWELGLKIDTEKWHCDKFPFVTDKPIIIDFKTREKWKTGNGGGGVCFEQPAIDALMNCIYPAPQTDELLAILPARMANVGLLKIYKLEDEYDVTYASIYPQTHSILCEALGLMCKHLLTNDYEFNGKEIVRKGEKWTII